MTVTLVAGPPAAGKSSYVAERLRPGELVWDYDTVMAAVTGLPMWHRSPSGHRAVMRIRQTVAELRPPVDWWILSAPTRAERDGWREVGARVVVVLAPVDVLIERVRDRPDRDGWEQAIGRWWQAYEADPADEVVHTGGA